MKESERKRIRYREIKVTGMSHAMKANGKTYCGRYPAWNIEIKEVFTCKSCETALKKYKQLWVINELVNTQTS